MHLSTDLDFIFSGDYVNQHMHVSWALIRYFENCICVLLVLFSWCMESAGEGSKCGVAASGGTSSSTGPVCASWPFDNRLLIDIYKALSHNLQWILLTLNVFVFKFFKEKLKFPV